ncbi:UvrD-helicase domain-containing protein [Spartinivicinus poritis]|uniref:DNA 3'-5' helicase n=1 Tax=Spartinivicinus poritis TaxID=2994640 RepID=A0ABT5UFS3_9GAMM|nr:ATP-dependent helicase [Spartinivicinus sp. A2-2]MDE1464836.1 ATP-dependent helicase [Spartinivicinus sp. A2-2]
MSKYLSSDLWKPSNGFIATETEDKIIKEKYKNLSILAGPGAGKTEILAQRANFLLQTGICKAPQKILALSFKVDAATNINNRVTLRCGRELSRRFISSTFDAFFISIVRRFSTLLPDWIQMPANFDVYPFDKYWWDDYQRKELGGQVFHCKKSYSPLDLSLEPNGAIVNFWDYCTVNKIADYSMCCSMAFTIVKNYLQVRNLILSTYKYLFLDEFQDMTNAQYSFVKTVFKGSDTIITAVGDANQMIMGWAGANPKNFENLKKDFNLEIIPLVINHRSNSNIIGLVNYVIKDLTPKGEEPIVYQGTRTDSPPALSIGIKKFDDVNRESEYISKFINLIISDNVYLTPSDFVLILRQKSQDYFELSNEIFQNNGLNLRNEDALVVEDGVKIQDLMVEPLSVFLILLIRYKVGYINYMQEKELERLSSFFTGYDLSQDRDYKRLREFIVNLTLFLDLSSSIEKSVNKIIEVIGDERIKAVFPQYKSQYLTKVIKSFCTLFQNALDKNLQIIEQAINDYEGINQVKLMTIHKSKGLEFDTVFFVDFHEDSWWGLCKAVQQCDSEKQREEKNSFFVGISRAKERLFFTKSKGKWPPVISELLQGSDLVVDMPEIK